jgi:hypothetical protein
MLNKPRDHHSRASRLPTRAEFSSRHARYVDAQGRTYVLPRSDDPLFVREVEMRKADPGNYERELRRGLEFNPVAEVRELTSRVMMYVQLPPPVGAVAQRVTHAPTEGLYAPIPKLHARTRDEYRLLLRDTNTGQMYEAEVEESHFKRRAKSGFVLLAHVSRVSN